MKSSDDVRAFVANARWIFARTMPKNPHWYTLRKESPQDAFEAFVVFIRENGYREEFGGRWYIKFDVDGWSYWTMGAPLNETILINRRELRAPSAPATADGL